MLEVRYGMKILNLSCKKCRKIYILKIQVVYTFDVVSQSAQSFLHAVVQATAVSCWKRYLKGYCRPGGTGPVGPALAGPTFELGRIYLFLILKNIVNFLKLKAYTKIR